MNEFKDLNNILKDWMDSEPDGILTDADKRLCRHAYLIERAIEIATDYRELEGKLNQKTRDNQPLCIDWLLEQIREIGK